jgi:hypothetical protein
LTNPFIYDTIDFVDMICVCSLRKICINILQDGVSPRHTTIPNRHFGNLSPRTRNWKNGKCESIMSLKRPKNEEKFFQKVFLDFLNGLS